MRVLNGVIGCVLLTIAILHAFIPHSGFFTLLVLYSAGALLAFLTWSHRLTLSMARVLAICTTALMFFYFAGFFTMAPHFTETWYQSASALEAIGLLLSAFAMIPVLSCYSCMLKAECRESLEEGKAPARGGFFSVPNHVHK